MTSKDLRALVEETGFNANNNMSGTLIFHLIKGKEELRMMTLMFLESNPSPALINCAIGQNCF